MRSRFIPQASVYARFALSAAIAGGLLTGCVDNFSAGEHSPPLMADDSEFVSGLVSEARRERILSQFHKIDDTIEIDAIKHTPAPGIVEVALADGQVVYADEKAEFLFTGKMLQITDNGVVDLSQLSKQKEALALLDKVGSADMVVYSPDEVKGRITVFTDVDCPYCQKLHGEVPELLAQGIEVRYLAFPRAGLKSETFKKMEAIWCSEDRGLAMDNSMTGESVSVDSCISPVAEQYVMAQQLGVHGTPAVIFDNGQIQPGYAPAQAIAEAVFSISSK